MVCGQALISLFLLAPCEPGGGPEAIQAAVADAARSETDIARDVQRKPAEILDFFGIAPGMTVLEVFAGGGYYTQILDGVVGVNGKVLAHNNDAYLQYVGAQFQTRFEDNGLPNSEPVIGEANELTFETDSLDAAVMILAYHDFLFGDDSFGWPDVDESAFISTLCDAIRPGGVLAIWSEDRSPAFEKRLARAGFDVHAVVLAGVR